ncbi:MAG: DUF3445 domain-containing protein [Gammaproteobacteria bacterium]|nr:DUF3445 domain-containing protein [Gammaproteobacteria bacterium]MDP6164642.1 DUF3445 domain-containing protein [Gammaproteobacteria bacterium]
MINSPLPASLPHMRDNSVMQMGMQVVSDSQWLQPCIDLEPYYQHKQQIHQAYGQQVFDGLPESQAAQRELVDLLKQHLLQDHGQVYAQMGDQLTHLPSGILLDIPAAGGNHSLWPASLWVADDLLLMQARHGQYCLTAASLCSPSSWRLQDKLGKPMARIHDPVPGIHQQLTPKIDQFLSNMADGQVVQRYNWSLQEAQQLAQFPHSISAPLAADTPLFYRMERQSLRRLPGTQAIVFGIRVYLFDMTSLAQIHGALPSLQAAIDGLPPALRGYKNIDYYQPALDKYWSSS